MFSKSTTIRHVETTLHTFTPSPRAPAFTLQVRRALQSFHSTMGTHSDTAVSAALQSGHQRILTKSKMTTPHHKAVLKLWATIPKQPSESTNIYIMIMTVEKITVMK